MLNPLLHFEQVSVLRERGIHAWASQEAFRANCETLSRHDKNTPHYAPG